MILVDIGLYLRLDVAIQIGLYFLAVQPVVSTVMAMAKTDVRNYTLKLLTLSYIFGRE